MTNCVSSTHRVHCLFWKLALPGNQQPDLEAECGQKKFPLSRSRGRDDTQSYIYRAMHPGTPGSVMRATRKVSAEGEGSSRLLGDRNQYICAHRPAPEAAVPTVHTEPRLLWKSVAGDKCEPWDRTALPSHPPAHGSNTLLMQKLREKQNRLIIAQRPSCAGPVWLVPPVFCLNVPTQVGTHTQHICVCT